MKEPFYQGSSNQDQLERINIVLGTQNLIEYVKKYNITLDEDFEGILGRHSEKSWAKFISPNNKHLCSKEVLDILTKMMIYDHAERITPTEAMKHPFFDSVRKSIPNTVSNINANQGFK